MDSRSDSDRSVFLPRLQSGETLLWQGRPLPEAYARHHYNPYLLTGVGLAACFFAAWELLSLVPLAARLGQESWVPLVMLLLFGISYNKVAHLLSYGLRVRAAQTFYAVTSRRIMIAIRGATPQSSNYDELHLSDLHLTRRELPLGVGSIFFGVTPFHFSMAFRGIEDVQRVYTLIEDARQKQIASELLRPVSYARPDVWDKYKEEGETFIWRGKPCVLQSLIFFVMGCGFAAALGTVVAADAPHLLAAPLGSATLKSLAMWLWAVFLISLFWAAADEAYRTFYAVTDRRVLRLYRVGKCYRFLEISLSQIHFLTLEWRLLQLGTISFGNQAARESQFRTIWKVPALQRSILEAKQRQKAQPQKARLP